MTVVDTRAYVHWHLEQSMLVGKYELPGAFPLAWNKIGV